jgi:lateral signaling target protein 2
MQVDKKLTQIIEHLESCDPRRQSHECTALLTQLRRHQSTVLNLLLTLCGYFVPSEERPTRDYRIKFPEDVLTDVLPGQLWFGAECLAGKHKIWQRTFSVTFRDFSIFGAFFTFFIT